MTSTSVRAATDARVRGGVRATYLAFGASGFAFASWASRIPQVRDRLGLEPAQLGLVLLAIAAGSVVALPIAGPAIHRASTRRIVVAMAFVLAIGLATAALGQLAGVVPVVVGLFLLGFGNGAWDVAMNVQGATVERRLGRSIMPRFHAAFSLGTVAGALLGALMIAVHVPVAAHLVGVAAAVALVVPWGTRGFLPDEDGHPDDHVDGHPDNGVDGSVDRPAEAPAPARSALAAWREPRTLLVGVFVLAFAFAEGTGNDWIGVAVIDGYRLPAAVGTLAFALFLASMTLGRWFGPGLLDRYGRVVVVRALAAVAVAGSLLFVFAPVSPLAFAGAVLWGVGTSLGFPVGMSAGADEPRYAAGRVSVIASIGYVAFLGGPPVVGFLGDHLGVLRALVVVTVLLGLAALISTVVAAPGERDA